MMREYDCNYSKFDAYQHKLKYPHYCEVVILKDGTVEYAHPSHQEKLVRLACEQLDISREELQSLCPPEYYFDFDVWLESQSGAMPVWTKFYGSSNPTAEQLYALQLLKNEGIYEGTLSDNIWKR